MSPVQWKPETATYSIGEVKNIGVTMSDGTVLRVNVFYPTTSSGAMAKGAFPVLLTQVPYGKASVGENPYFVERGYIEVVADVRGTGDSQGTFGLFDPVQATDGATLVQWCADLPDASPALPKSDGKVGLFGASYFGINQLLTAAAVGPHSPLKAIFPELVANDLYRDTVFFGGAFDVEFVSIFLGGMAAFDLENPPLETLQAPTPNIADGAGVELQHLGDALSFQAATLENFATGGDWDYEGAYWAARNPVNMLAKIVANGIPAFLVGGWYDLFQHGELLDYSGLQNAYDGRPVTAPMTAEQPLTGRYQLLMEPRYHESCCAPVTAAPDDNALQLAWFDHFLKGEDTGIVDVRHPLHVYLLGANQYVDVDRYPFLAATPTTLYLGAGPSGAQAPSLNDGTLGAVEPTAATGADTVLFMPVTQVCDRQTDQWSAGLPTVGAQALGLPDFPCSTDDIAMQVGPGALTYTSAPFKADEIIAGPVDVTLYASSTTADAFFEATLEDIPAGSTASSVPLTSGALLGSFRAVDRAHSWFASDGQPLMPYHPYTRASVKAVPMGKVTRFDIEVFPTFAEIKKGDRLRLTITTNDTPHLAFNVQQLANLIGGVYSVQRNAKAASFVELPLAPADTYTTPCQLCVNPLP